MNGTFYQDVIATIATSTTTSSTVDNVDSLILINCTIYKEYYNQTVKSYAPVMIQLSRIKYVIVIIGVLLNCLNLIVLLNSKLNESPYTYLTSLALFDFTALFIYIVEKIRRLIMTQNSNFIFKYLVLPAINICSSCSIYITLALTIERFIFVHYPLKSKVICSRSIARRICCYIFIFSIVRNSYLPFMYEGQICKNF
jgi:hypothetical protein